MRSTLPRWSTTALLAVACLGLTAVACKTKGGSSSPERLAAAHREALIADDPRAAYALLSPEARAKTPYASYEARWKTDASERATTIEAARAMPEAQGGAVHSGTTVHDNGLVLHWTEAGGDYLVVSGLPGRTQSATPAQAIRSFVRAVRRANLEEVRTLLSDEMATALEEDWAARVDAIEAALLQPGALELSSDLQRAVLRYDALRTVTLLQTSQGWRIMSLQ